MADKSVELEQFRTYNGFDKPAIYPLETDTFSDPDSENNYSNSPGWRDDYYSDDYSTPINADNLNAMLNMLIYTRNVIGKTTDFAASINGVDLYKSKQEGDKEVEDIENSVYPNPDNLDNRSIARYLEAAFNAIVGSGDDISNTSIDRTLSGLKSYLESLDLSKQEETSKWVKTIQQIDGKLSVTLDQPTASDISYNSDENDINIKDKTDLASIVRNLDRLIGNLSEILYNESAVISVSEALSKEKQAREVADQEHNNAINAINSTKTGILAQSKEYTDTQIKGLDFTDTAISNQFVTSVSQTDGKISIERTLLTSNDIPKLASDKISDFDSAVKGIKVDNATRADNDSNGNKISETYATKEEVSAIELLDSKVKMSDNLRITETFGKYSPSSKGYVDIECKDKTVREFLLDALQVASVGTIDHPSFTYTSGATSRSGEVGSAFAAPTCIFTVTDVGNYQYGPATDITFNGTLTADGVADVVFDSLSENNDNNTAFIKAKEGGTYSTTSQTITFGGTYKYSQGASPKTNIDTTDSTKSIPEKSDGTLSHSCTYTGYYNIFIGMGDANNIESKDIRALTAVKESKSSLAVDASKNNISIIWAIRKDFTSNRPTFTYKLFGNYETLEGVVGPVEVNVKDGSGIDDVLYNVYTYTPAGGKFTAPMNTKITIN